MKQMIFACFFGSICLQMMGQDDMYFLSSKKADIKSQVSRIVNKPETDSSDIISFDAVRGEYPDSLYNESADYQCTRNMKRFDGYDWQDAYTQGYRDGSFDSYSWNYSWPYSYYYGYYDPWYDPYYYSWYYPGWHYNSWSLYYRPYYHHWCYRPTYYRPSRSYTNRHVSVTRRHQVPQNYRSGAERNQSVTRNFGSEYRSNTSSSMRSRSTGGVGNFRSGGGGGGGTHRGAR